MTAWRRVWPLDLRREDALSRFQTTFGSLTAVAPASVSSWSTNATPAAILPPAPNTQATRQLSVDAVRRRLSALLPATFSCDVDRPLVQRNRSSYELWSTEYGFGTTPLDRQGLEHAWLDGDLGLLFSFASGYTYDLCVALTEPEPGHLALLQVQSLRRQGNRWRFRLGGNPHGWVLGLVAAAFPDHQLWQPDGEQKFAQLSGLHGGFSREELEAMGWSEWADGREVLPRVLAQYDGLAPGLSWGGERRWLKARSGASSQRVGVRLIRRG